MDANPVGCTPEDALLNKNNLPVSYNATPTPAGLEAGLAVPKADSPPSSSGKGGINGHHIIAAATFLSLSIWEGLRSRRRSREELVGECVLIVVATVALLLISAHHTRYPAVLPRVLLEDYTEAVKLGAQFIAVEAASILYFYQYIQWQKTPFKDQYWASIIFQVVLAIFWLPWATAIVSVTPIYLIASLYLVLPLPRCLSRSIEAADQSNMLTAGVACTVLALYSVLTYLIYFHK